MKKNKLVFIAVSLISIFCIFYFQFPLNLFGPVFHTDAINRYAQEYGLDPLLITAVIKVESNFIRRARSHRGAIGLMQILPSTAQELAPELGYNDFSKVDLEDPDTNIRFGALYINKLLGEFNGNKILAIAAYNAGKSKVQSWYLQNPLVSIESSDIPYRETRNYVDDVMRIYRSLTKIQKTANLFNSRKN